MQTWGGKISPRRQPEIGTSAAESQKSRNSGKRLRTRHLFQPDQGVGFPEISRSRCQTVSLISHLQEGNESVVAAKTLQEAIEQSETRWRVYRAEGEQPRDRSPYSFELRGSRGAIYLHSPGMICVEVNGKSKQSVTYALRELAPLGSIHQLGDSELTILTNISNLDVCANYIKARRKPSYTEEQLARLRENARKNLCGNTKPGSTE